MMWYIYLISENFISFGERERGLRYSKHSNHLVLRVFYIK